MGDPYLSLTPIRTPSNANQPQGFAPGSWSQVALDRTRPNSHVLGIDILPAQPPRGVSSVQGNFLSPAVQSIVRESLREADARRAALPKEPAQKEEEVQEAGSDREGGEAAGRGNEVVEKMSYLDMEKKEMRDLDGREDNDRVADVHPSPFSPPFALPHRRLSRPIWCSAWRLTMCRSSSVTCQPPGSPPLTSARPE